MAAQLPVHRGPGLSTRLALLALRLLALSFALVGAQFALAPDATIRNLDAAGAWFGDFAPTPATGARLWLALAVAYMVLVTLFAWLAQRDLARARPYLALLFAGKASSSLGALAAYHSVAPTFPYLANFLVDGAIAAGVAVIWVAAPRLALAGQAPRLRAAPALGARSQRVLRAALEALAPPGAGAIPHDADPAEWAAAVEGFARDAGGLAGVRALLCALELSPFVLPPIWLRRFSKLALEDRVRVLEAWEHSRLPGRREGVALLKLLALPQIYGRPELLRAMGYPDPLDRVPLDEPLAAPRAQAAP